MKTLKQIEKERYRNEIIKNERNRIKKLIDELDDDMHVDTSLSFLECWNIIKPELKVRIK